MLQTLYTLSDDETEYQLSFMRFVGLALHDVTPPNAETIWLSVRS